MADRAFTTRKLGRYDLTRVLGKGAMGVVYEARDPNLDRKVAIKVIGVDSLSPLEATEYELRFRTEAHSAARLQHPNIVSVYDSDRDGETPFLVMEFIKGDDLKHYLDIGRRYSLEQSVRMVCDLLSALEYAHHHKIIHRDIKPANMMIEASGRVKLTDFGVARIQDSGDTTRTQGGMVGTLKYMSPEQVEGKSIDAASDLFSAGIVLYQLLTDRRPFDGDSYFAIVNQITTLDPAAPSSINPMLPTELDAVVARALSKNKDQRFPTAHEFAQALQTAARSADPTIVPSANPLKHIRRSDSAPHERSGSTVNLNAGGTGGSTITQELELVYWKDVKDSDDVQDLDGFLSRFPEGVYADLAKRRLKRIAGVGTLPGQYLFEKTEVVSSLDSPGRKAATGATAGVDIAQDITFPGPAPLPPRSEATPPDSEPSGFAQTEIIDLIPVAKATPEQAANAIVVVPPQKGPSKRRASHAVRTPAPPRKPMWPIGLAAAALLAVAAWAWISPGGNSKPASVAHSGTDSVAVAVAASAPAPPASGASASIPGVPAALSPSLVATPEVTLASAPASTLPAAATPTTKISLKPATGASAARPAALREPQARPVVVTAPASAPSTPVASPAAERQTRPDNRPPAPPASSPRPTATATAAQSSASSDPRESCQGQVLFAYGSCLYEKCALPSFHGHPVCVDQREQNERRKRMEQNR